MTDLSAPLIVEVLTAERSGLGVVRLHEIYEATTDTMGLVTIPAGYETDFASIPRIARPFICQMGKCARAALLHDWLLHLDANHSRSARVFSEALRASNVSTVGRWIMVAFVWVFTLRAPDKIAGVSL
jgi:hypothetical protein